jgi:chaperone required for assembly of F1-ATPase
MASDRSIFELPPEPVDPVAMARRDLKKSLPKRFWKEVTVAAEANGYGIALDGRPTRTPSRQALVLPNRALAEAVAQEWREVGEHLDPALMPLTRIVNSALDGVANAMEPTAAELARYAASDLLCYRAEGPDKLVERQNAHWDPVLDWARQRHGWRFELAAGVMHVPQPSETLEAVKAYLIGIGEPLRLAALHVATTLTGSVLLALSLAEGEFGPTAVWNAAHVDEDHQMALWGEDEEALARRAVRHAEFLAAVTILAGLA